MKILSTFLGLLLALAMAVPSTSQHRNHNCYQLVDYGRCQGHKLMWAYSSFDKKCFMFLYSSCGGNANRFATQDECEKTCKWNN